VDGAQVSGLHVPPPTPQVLESLGARVGRAHAGEAARPAATLGARRIALVCAKFNGAITERLVGGALRALEDLGVDKAAVELAWVPGAFELPVVTARLARSGLVGAVVALGAVIRGQTAHFEYVAGPCAQGLQRVALDTGVPVVFGVLTTEDVDQAMARSGDDGANKGYEAVATALEMIDLLDRLPAPED
jgi:6,7-dimethyl-8-ribityllumazine synthase